MTPQMSLRGQHFLFLQGLASPFFGELAKHFRAQGATVDRVNFRGGDKLWWSGPAIDYRRRMEELPEFYERLFRERSITDVILFGDMRPVHRPVHAIAAAHRARVHVFEEAYIRPHWVTIEREGVNLNSPLPRDPGWYRRAAKTLPTEPDIEPVRVPMPLRAAQDMAYRLSSASDPLLFPHYRTHRPRRALVEYTGWALRYGTFALKAKADAECMRRTRNSKGPVFLLPLQLNGDSQILHHSEFDSVGSVIRHVIASFAEHAPCDARLLIKNHPLDPGLDGHHRVARIAAREGGVSDRVDYLDTKNLADVFPHINGVVLVNSTTGLSAIWRGIPVHPLADPVYKMPGLTHTGELRDFWRNPEPPDPGLYDAFRRVLLEVNHLNGDYFTAKGISLAVKDSRRFFRPLSPLEELLRKVPLGLNGSGKTVAGSAGKFARC